MDQPAWSEAFTPDRLTPIRALALPEPITADWAWGGATGAGVKVAVVDSGVDGSHPYVKGIAGGVALEYDPDAPGSVRFDDSPHDDLFGHGTACAGLIRALAPDCELFSVRVLGRKLSGKGLVLAAGIRWAIDNHMNVVNLSLSTKSAELFGPLHELVDEAYFRGVLLVSAVNNSPMPSYPSLYSSVISVAARSNDGPQTFAYNPEPPVEFGAPGFDVDVAWLDGAVITATGNSFAAPVVAGYVARTLSKHPGLTPFQVKTILHAVADNVATPDP
ncbi:MAG: S8 family serine peptidase [Mycobacteriales bacterium]